MATLGMKVTIEFICHNMIDAESLQKEFDNDPMKAYLDISDNGNDSIQDFADDGEKIIKVETFTEAEETESTT